MRIALCKSLWATLGCCALFGLMEIQASVATAAASRANVLDNMKQRLATQLHDVGYPYAEVVKDRLSKARTRMPMPDELVFPRVASLKPSQDGKGRPVAEFTIEWNVAELLAAESEAGSKYWTFVHVLGAGARTIVTRATLWPNPPTTGLSQ